MNNLSEKTPFTILAGYFLAALFFFLQSEITKILDKNFANWAFEGTLGLTTLLLAFWLGRNGDILYRKAVEFWHGIRLEIVKSGKNPFLFENMGRKGILNGEVLHYSLVVRCTALRYLRDLSARIAVYENHRLFCEGDLPQLSGTRVRGHSNDIRLATLEIEHRGMASGAGMSPHSESGPVKLSASGRPFQIVGSCTRVRCKIIVRHASGTAAREILLFISSGVPNPAEILAVSGEIHA